MRQKRDVSATPVVETCGEGFVDGPIIDLVRHPDDGSLHLLFSDGTSHNIAPRVEYRGQTYAPAELDHALWHAMILPTQPAEYGSTSELFESTRNLFSNFEFGAAAAWTAAYVAFASNFTELFNTAPIVAVSGPRPEASLYFDLLACVVRRPLRLIESAACALASFPGNLRPTALIDYASMKRSQWQLLLASSARQALFSRHRSFRSAYGIKITYVGLSSSEIPCDSGLVLRINLSPFCEKLPIVRPDLQQKIADEFQTKLLMYRLRNFQKVRTSEFDLSEFSSDQRVLAHIIGSCIVDAPEVQSGIRELLKGEEENSRVQRFRDPRCATIDAILSVCHEKSKNFYVGELTRRVNCILAGRGQTAELSRNEVGDILRKFELVPQRKSKGYRVEVTEEVDRKVHLLARDYRVPTFEEGVSRCELCAEIMNSKAEIVSSE